MKPQTLKRLAKCYFYFEIANLIVFFFTFNFVLLINCVLGCIVSWLLSNARRKRQAEEAAIQLNDPMEASNLLSSLSSNIPQMLAEVQSREAKIKNAFTLMYILILSILGVASIVAAVVSFSFLNN